MNEHRFSQPWDTLQQPVPASQKAEENLLHGLTLTYDTLRDLSTKRLEAPSEIAYPIFDRFDRRRLHPYSLFMLPNALNDLV